MLQRYAEQRGRELGFYPFFSPTKMTLTSLAGVVFLLAVCLGQTQVQPGVLDQTFGQMGVYLQPLDEVDSVVGSVVLDDGSVMLAKAATKRVGKALVRSLRVSFAPGSVTNFNRTIDLFSGGLSDVRAQVAELVPGGILIAGLASSISSTSPLIVQSSFIFAVLLRQSDGAPVASFGTNGVLLIPASSIREVTLNAVVLLGDSFMLLGSVRANATAVGPTAIALKVFYNGSVDLRWGVDGLLRYGAPISDVACGFLMPPLHLVAVGTINRGSKNSQIGVDIVPLNAPANSTRSLFRFPLSFSSGEVANASTATWCVRTPSGGILVAGTSGNMFAAMLLKKTTASVELDTSFGVGGSLLLPYVSPKVTERFVLASIMPTGSFVLSGATGEVPFVEQAIRLLPSGAVDPTWSTAPLNLGSGFVLMDVVDVTRTGRILTSGRAIAVGSAGMSYAVVAEPNAVPCGAGPQCFCVGGVCMTQGDYVAPPNATSADEVAQQLIQGNVTINGNLIANANGQIIIRPVSSGSGQVTVGGTTFAGGTIVVQVTGAGNFSLISSGGGIVGNFGGVSVDNSQLPACQIGNASLAQAADGSSLNVLVDVRRDPNFCLTPAETAGLAVGAIAVGVAIALGIVLFLRRQTALYTKSRNAELKEQSLTDMKGSSNPAFGAGLRAEEL